MSTLSSAPIWVRETKGFPVKDFKSVAGADDGTISLVVHASADYYHSGGKVGTYVNAAYAQRFMDDQRATQELVMLEPSKGVKLWKAAFDARTPTGMNTTLWSLTHAFGTVMDFARKTRPVSLSNPHHPLLVHLRAGIFKHCQRIITEDTFVQEHPASRSLTSGAINATDTGRSSLQFFVWRMLGIISTFCLYYQENVDGPIPPSLKACVPSREDVLMLPAKLWHMLSVRRDIFTDGDLYDRSLPGSASKFRENLRVLLHAFCPVRQVRIVNAHDLHIKGLKYLRSLLLLAWFSGTQDGSDEETHANIILQYACILWSGNQLPTGPLSGVSDDEVLEFFEKDVIPVYGSESFLARLRVTLELLEADDDEGSTMTTFRDISRALIHPAFRAHLVSSGVLEIVMRKFRKVLDASSLDTDDMSTHITLFPTILPFINGVSKPADANPLVAQLLREYDSMLWVSTGLLSSARLNAKNTTSVTDIVRTYQAMAQRLKRQDGDEATYKLLLSSLRRVWYGTLATLHELQQHHYSTSREGLVLMWRRFGLAAGLDEDREKKEFEKHADKLCSWTTCPHHVSFSKTSTSFCKGCGKARYCSRVCQQKLGLESRKA
ncbi:unnamed protein product [Peniophora sp. CBMAI 1063]|nr:unnamed protein product [Peniophora sp. CBMAI 1063]